MNTFNIKCVNSIINLVFVCAYNFNLIYAFILTDVQLLMSSGLETEPPITSSLLEEEETCGHGNGQPQADSISSSANGPQLGTAQHGAEAAREMFAGQGNMNASDAGMGF